MMYDRPWRPLARTLTFSQRAAVIDAIARGATPTQLADQYGVHRRTIRRIVERGRAQVHVADIDGWTAEFVVDPERGPIRVSEWVER